MASPGPSHYPVRMRMPALFVGHGNPMNAIQDNAWSRAWKRLGGSLPRPRSILAISAHWYVAETAVTVDARPRTIHDFGGFPRELFEVQYPAPGDPALATRIGVKPGTWGIDHGTWSVLVHLFPKADVPVVQLSIDRRQPPRFHFDLGRKLAPLRDEGVLILGSGNVVHNLAEYAWGEEAEPRDWAARFEGLVKERILAGGDLADPKALGPDAARSIPTPDHFLPLLYVLGARAEGEPASFPVEGIEGGTISMLSVKLG